MISQFPREHSVIISSLNVLRHFSLSIIGFMFPFALSSQEYKVDANWRLRSTVLTPMFVETQASQSERGGSAGSQPSSMDGQVRATQGSLEFSLTQAPGAGMGITPASDITVQTKGRHGEDDLCICAYRTVFKMYFM